MFLEKVTYTHTHTHAIRERERGKGRDREIEINRQKAGKIIISSWCVRNGDKVREGEKKEKLERDIKNHP